MVETGVFFVCNSVFFLGHTNNDAYFLFGLLKGGYYKRDIFTHEEWFKILDKNPQVEATIIKPEGFID